MEVYPTYIYGDENGPWVIAPPNNYGRVTFESAQGGGFLITTPAQYQTLSYADASTASISFWTQLLFQDGAVRKDTYIKGETAAMLGGLEIVAWNPSLGDLIPMSEEAGAIDLMDAGSPRFLNLTDLPDDDDDDYSGPGSYNNQAVCNLIFAQGNETDFGLTG